LKLFARPGESAYEWTCFADVSDLLASHLHSNKWAVCPPTSHPHPPNNQYQNLVDSRGRLMSDEEGPTLTTTQNSSYKFWCHVVSRAVFSQTSPKLLKSPIGSPQPPVCQLPCEILFSWRCKAQRPPIPTQLGSVAAAVRMLFTWLTGSQSGQERTGRQGRGGPPPAGRRTFTPLLCRASRGGGFQAPPPPPPARAGTHS